MTALARKVAEDIATLTVAALERERETTERILSEKGRAAELRRDGVPVTLRRGGK